MAPEQASGQQVDHRADLFSLGSVLYYMCTGKLPFNAPAAISVVHRVTKDHPVPVRECNRNVPPWLAELITDLHAKDPNRRPLSADVVREALLAREYCGPTQSILPARAALPAADGPRQLLSRRALFTGIVGLVFLTSLPAFYFLTSPAGGVERGLETPVAEVDRRLEHPEPSPECEHVRKTAESASAKPAPVAPRHAASTALPVTAAKRRESTLDLERPQAAPQKAVGNVVLLANDPTCLAFFRTDGLSAQYAKTSGVLALNLGRNSLALGEYEVLPVNPAAGLKVSPRRFSLTADRSVTLTIVRAPVNQTLLPNPGDAPPPLPELPPFPPPPDRLRAPPLAVETAQGPEQSAEGRS